jgi:hypothetical protein
VSQILPQSARKCVIYALSSPKNPSLVRYVGKTWYPLEKRNRQHVCERNRRRSPKNDWVCSLVKNGLKPLIWPLEVCDEAVWGDREKYWISFFKPILLNVAQGGDSGPIRSGWKHTKESLAKMSKAQKGRVMPKAFLESPLKFGKGSKHSEASKLKMSLSRKGVPPPRLDFMLARAREATLGKKRPPETVLKIKEGTIRRFLKDSEHIKLSEAFVRVRRKERKVICVENGYIFPSYQVAADWAGALHRGMRQTILAGQRCAGLTFKFLD